MGMIFQYIVLISNMNKFATVLGITLIGLSFYSIGPVLCETLYSGCASSEHYLAVLPYFVGVLIGGAVLLAVGLKSLSIWSLTKP